MNPDYWRIGFGGQSFEMLKFRTMVQGAEARRPELARANESDGPLFKIRHDPRVTRVGAACASTPSTSYPSSSTW